MTGRHEVLAAIEWAGEAVEDTAAHVADITAINPALGADLGRRFAGLLPALKTAMLALLPPAVEREYCPEGERFETLQRWYDRGRKHAAVLRKNGELWLRAGPCAAYKLVLEKTDGAAAARWLARQGKFYEVNNQSPSQMWGHDEDGYVY